MDSPAEFTTPQSPAVSAGERPEFQATVWHTSTGLTTDPARVPHEGRCGPRPHIAEHPVYQDLLARARRFTDHAEHCFT